MKKFFAIASFVVAIVALSGCKDTRKEFSEPKHEDATIMNAVYTPSRHNTVIEPSIMSSDGIGLGLGFSGNVGLHVGMGVQITSVTVPEKFAMVFHCQHGQFIVSRREVYEKMKDWVGKKVDVEYKEVYLTTYEKKDGQTVPVSRELTDYKFIDATLK